LHHAKRDQLLFSPGEELAYLHGQAHCLVPGLEVIYLRAVPVEPYYPEGDPCVRQAPFYQPGGVLEVRGGLGIIGVPAAYLAVALLVISVKGDYDAAWAALYEPVKYRRGKLRRVDRKGDVEPFARCVSGHLAYLRVQEGFAEVEELYLFFADRLREAGYLVYDLLIEPHFHEPDLALHAPGPWAHDARIRAAVRGLYLVDVRLAGTLKLKELGPACSAFQG